MSKFSLFYLVHTAANAEAILSRFDHADKVGVTIAHGACGLAVAVVVVLTAAVGVLKHVFGAINVARHLLIGTRVQVMSNSDKA